MMKYRDRILLVAIAGVISSILGKLYILQHYMYARTFGEFNRDYDLFQNLGDLCDTVLVISIIAVIILGIFADPILKKIERKKNDQ